MPSQPERTSKTMTMTTAAALLACCLLAPTIQLCGASIERQSATNELLVSSISREPSQLVDEPLNRPLIDTMKAATTTNDLVEPQQQQQHQQQQSLQLQQQHQLHSSSIDELPSRRQRVINGNQATYVEPPADFKPIIYNFEPISERPAAVAEQDQAATSGQRGEWSHQVDKLGLSASQSQLDELGSSGSRAPPTFEHRFADWRDLSIEPDLASSESRELGPARVDGQPGPGMISAVPALSPFRIRKPSDGPRQASEQDSQLASNWLYEEPQASGSEPVYSIVAHQPSAVPVVEKKPRQTVQVKRSSSSSSSTQVLGPIPSVHPVAPVAAAAATSVIAKRAAAGTKSAEFGSAIHYHNHDEPSESIVGHHRRPHNLITTLTSTSTSARLQTPAELLLTHRKEQQVQQHQQLANQPANQQPLAASHGQANQVASSQQAAGEQQPQHYQAANQQLVSAGKSGSASQSAAKQAARRQRRRKFRSSAEVRRIQQQQNEQQQHSQLLQLGKTAADIKLAPAHHNHQVPNAIKQVNGLALASSKLGSGSPTTSTSAGQLGATPQAHLLPIRLLEQQAAPAGNRQQQQVSKRHGTSSSANLAANKRKQLKSQLPVGLSSWFLGGIRDLDGRHWHLPADLMSKLAINDVDLHHPTASNFGEREQASSPSPMAAPAPKHSSSGHTPNQLVPR